LKFLPIRLYGCSPYRNIHYIFMLSMPVEKKLIQVAIVEDDDGIRANLEHLIRTSDIYSFVGSYSDAETALIEIPLRRPDVVLMDINLPKLDGVEFVRRLKLKLPQVQFMMLTVYEDNNRLLKSLVAGASGYLLKRTPPERLLAAIQEVYSGGAPMTPEMARRVVQHFHQPVRSSAHMPKLTPREEDVLKQLAKGALYKEIEENLGISAGTLRSYITNVYEKLHVHSRTEAVVKYLNR
jgi:DNA-binding NarL/FixJ family response regulator